MALDISPTEVGRLVASLLLELRGERCLRHRSSDYDDDDSMDEEELDLGEQSGDSDDGGAAAAADSAAEQQHSSRAVERQRNLEEALLLQRDMQKRLHEQLEVGLARHTSAPLPAVLAAHCSHM